MTTAVPSTISVAEILGLREVRVARNEKVKLSEGGRWFIRPAVKVINVDGKIQWSRGKRLYMQSRNKREAQAEANAILRQLESERVVLQSQIRFEDMLDHFLKWARDPNNLSASTLEKYKNHIRNHLRPAFGNLMMCEVTTKRIEEEISKKRLAWSTKTDLKNLLSSVFSKARKWDYWNEINPASDVFVGRKREARPQVKLSIEDTRHLLATLKWDVRLICMVALFCCLRISEVLGLRWQDVDLEREVLRIRHRFYRGDLDVVKSERAKRDVPLGYLVNDLQNIAPGSPEDFVFSVHTHELTKKPRISRDDRDIHQHFLRPAAKALGLYRPGFGFHSLRREAVTAYDSLLSPQQVRRIAGHSRADMTARYTLADKEEQEQAVRTFQESILGKPEGGVQ